jgi:hypothetical protein
MSQNYAKLGEYFIRLPPCKSDGTNYIMYRDRFVFAADAAGLGDHLDPSITGPSPPPTPADPANPTAAETAAQVKFTSDQADWKAGEAVVKQGITATIPDSLFLKVKGESTAAAMWKKVKDEFEQRSKMMVVELRRRLHEEVCSETGDIKTHLMTLRTIREDLITMNADPGDDLFVAILLGSLPKSYDPYIAALTATAALTTQTLTPEMYIKGISDEADRRALRNRNQKGDKEVAFVAGNGSQKKNRHGKGKKDIECFNCHKKGHVKADCWAKGGGKEGQGPKKGKKLAANTATVDADDVWMAEVLSDDEWMENATENISGYVEPADEEKEEGIFGGIGAILTQNQLFSMIKEQHNTEPLAEMCSINLLSRFDLPLPSHTPNHTMAHTSTEDDLDDLPELQSVATSSECSDDEEDSIYEPSDDELFSNFDDDDMPDLQDVSDSESDDEDTEDINQHVQDNGDKAETSTYCSVFLATQGIETGVVTEIYDSGASRHMTPYRSKLINYIEIQPKEITAADKGTFKAIGRGDMRIKIPGPKGTSAEILLKDVLYAPHLSVSLISISKICTAGGAVMFRNDFCRIYNQKKKLIGEIKVANGLYRVYHPNEAGMAASHITRCSLDELHRRMGHISQKAAQRLIDDGIIDGIELTDRKEVSCDSCAYAKSTRKPIKRERTSPRASKMGEKVHADVWGPAPIMTPNHKEYFSTYTDDWGRWTYLYLQRLKSETFDSYKNCEALYNTQHDVKIQLLQSDRGGEFLDDDFTDHLSSHGTIRRLTTHDTPEHNGVAERLNRTLLEKVRAMLHASGLPLNLWGEALKHAVWLKNRTSTRALPDNKTPFEMIHHTKPDMSDLREFGAKVWVHDSTNHKLGARARVGRWLGFDPESADGHRIYYPDNRTIRVERSVRFDELEDVFMPGGNLNEGELEKFIQTSDTGEKSNNSPAEAPAPPSTPLPVIQMTQTTPPAPSNPVQKITLRRPDPKTQTAPDFLGDTFQPEIQHQQRERRQRVASRWVKDLEAGKGTYSARKNMPTLPTGTQAPSSSSKPTVQLADSLEFAATAEIDETSLEPTYDEAKTRSDWPEWRNATEIEYQTLLEAGTWQLVERPTEHNVVDCKWVLRRKLKSDGTTEKYKARLTAKGFTQVANVDYFETFAPVAKLGSIRSILAIAARNAWPIHQFDFHGAFLNGTLDDDEVIYMEQPPDFEVADKRKYVVRLVKTLYGLRQSSRKWYETLTHSLATLGFTPLETDHAVFTYHTPTDIVILAIHVDDTTITSNAINLLEHFQVEIGKLFQTTLLGPINWLLGIKITRDLENQSISLSQHSYIESVLRKFHMEQCKPVSTPLPSYPLSRNQCPTPDSDEARQMKQVPYREAVGSLMWAALATRPDLAYSVTTLSQFSDNPARIHWEAVKHVFRYLQGTKNLQLTYGGKGCTIGLVGYSDADGMSQEHRHAISGYIFMIDGGAVTWSAKKQEIVAISTTEAEYIALTYAAKEALWIRHFLEELFRKTLPYPITLYDDNQGAIALAYAEKGQFHARTKHIDIRFHFIRHTIQSNLIHVTYCPTEQMVADILTKTLSPKKVQLHVHSLGLLSE